MIIPNKLMQGLFILLISIGCKESPDKAQDKEPLTISALITPAEYKELNNRSVIKVIDARPFDKYLAGHIPEALNISRNDLIDTTFAYGGVKATRDHVQNLLRKNGIEKTDFLLLYDDGGSAEACRLWWVLAHYGYENTSILHGGLKSWALSGNNIVKEIPNYRYSNFTWENPDLEKLWIDKEDLLALVNNPNSSFTLLDVRSPEEYSGTLKRGGTKRFGHIPGSKNINYTSAMDPVEPTAFLNLAQLQEVYGKDLNKETDTIVVYCQSGVRSSHSTYVLSKLLGFKHVFNYEGSWAEWSYFEDLPIKTTVEFQ